MKVPVKVGESSSGVERVESFNLSRHSRRKWPAASPTYSQEQRRVALLQSAMASQQWYRVARGLQLVAESALSQTTAAAGATSARAAEHATDLARNARIAAEQANAAAAAAAAAGMGLRNDAWPSSSSSNNADSMTANSFATAPAVPQMKDVVSHEDAARPVADINGINPPAAPPVHDEPQAVATETNTYEERATPGSDVEKLSTSSLPQHDHFDDNAHTTTLAEGKPVPSTRVGRAFGFATLGVGLAAGTVVEATSRLFGGSTNKDGSVPEYSAIASDANADRLAAHLCRMRGAALKLGQMLSMQDEAFLAPPLARALARVRGSADAMPMYQLDSVLTEELGSDWREKLETFEDLPFAAASIGEVHRATVSPGGDTDSAPSRVAMKVQYPGVAESIDSDLNNLTMLVKATGLAPPGLFIDEVIRVGREELKVECNYKREAENQTRFRNLLLADDVLSGPECKLSVPRVIAELSTTRVLTTEFAQGGTIEKVSNLDQEERNRIGRAILRLTMKELFVWRFMQTDPNWGNFLYDMGTGTTHLIDFGAAREFSKEFVDGYLKIVKSSADQDTETLMDVSHQMGFLTGEENDIMLEAHKMSGFTVGEPFATDEAYDFGRSGISARLSGHSSAFLQHRLTPPPPEVYTLHRKLAGAYNLCIKLGAVIPCRDLLDEIVENHVDGVEST